MSFPPASDMRMVAPSTLRIYQDDNHGVHFLIMVIMLTHAQPLYIILCAFINCHGYRKCQLSAIRMEIKWKRMYFGLDQHSVQCYHYSDEDNNVLNNIYIILDKRFCLSVFSFSCCAVCQIISSDSGSATFIQI